MRLPRPQGQSALSLDEVARLLGTPAPEAPALGPVTGVTLDSRTVLPGDLYAALPGANVHGATFASAAVGAGAVAVVTDSAGAALIDDARQGSDHPRVPIFVVPDPRAILGAVASAVYGRPAESLQTFGITGTNGKTTTAYLLAAGLRGLEVRTGLIGTVETRLGDESLPSARTTPEAPELHALMAVMRERGAQALVMEVSSHALAQHRVDGVVYDVAIFTNLSQDHLDFHATMADYFKAKADLFTRARARRGVVCVGDTWGVRLAAEAAIPITTVGPEPEADWRVSGVTDGCFTMAGPSGDLTLPAHLPGTFNVMNAAVAAVALVTAGYAVPDVERAMHEPPAVPGRMEIVPGGPGDPRCIVDFAHTAEAVHSALAALRPTTPGRLIAVVGAGGDRDRGKRALMGAAAATWADDVVVTDDNPRTEDPASIRHEVTLGAASIGRHRQVVAGQDDGHDAHDAHDAPDATDERVLTESGRGRAADIAWAVQRARRSRPAADNTVVVLGKGHETGQEIAGVKHPFDDRDAVASALAGRPYRPSLDIRDIPGASA